MHSALRDHRVEAKRRGGVVARTADYRAEKRYVITESKRGFNMYQDNIVLCSASKYKQKFYLNEDFEGLPDLVKKELQIMCVLFTEDVGGIIILEFDADGNLNIKTEAYEEDILYDEIGSVLKVKQLQETKKDLFEQLEQYFQTFF